MRSVVCFQDLKSAALYFDRVLPVAFRRMAGTGTDIVTEFPEPIPSRALINIVFDMEAKAGNERYTEFGRVIDGWDQFRKEAHPYLKQSARSSAETDYSDLHAAYLADASAPGTRPLRKIFAEYASTLEVRDAAVLLPSSNSSTCSGFEDSIVSLSGVSLIDPDRATWEQIIELRSDFDSRRRLQRLRAFVTENYVGKSRAYVEDDLSSRLDEYQQVKRKHGFESVVGSIGSLVDSSNIQAATSAGLATALLGGPWAGISSAVLIEVGKVAIEFAKRRRAMVDWRNSHPLAYLVQLQSEMN